MIYFEFESPNYRRRKSDAIAQWDDASTPDGETPSSNFTDALDWVLGSNLVTKLLVIFGSNKIKRSDEYCVSKAVSSSTAQSCPRSIQINDENKARFTKNLNTQWLMKANAILTI